MSEPPTPYAAHTPAPVRFRVFDPATGEMHYPDGKGVAYTIPGDGAGVIRTGGRLGIELWPGAVALLSTGLRDADGVEVFDGDLVALDLLDPDEGAPCRVGLGVFVDPDDLERKNGWHVVDLDSGLCIPMFANRGFCDVRVIGNVYQGLREPA